MKLVDGITQGYPPLRDAIAKYLAKVRGLVCEAEQIVIVNGSQQAMELAGKVLLDPGRTIAVEDPGYPACRGAFLSSGLSLLPIEVNNDGISVDRLSEQKNVGAVCVTPSHQFPLGVVMSLSRRLELLEWANVNDSWIIEDDYDSEFRYEGNPLASLQGLDTNQKVIYIGTFSKVLFPSLRLGYLVLPPDLVEVFNRMVSYSTVHASLFDQLTLAEFVKQGRFEGHIRKMRKLYEERQSLLVREVRKTLDEFIEVEKSPSGLHVIGWLRKHQSDLKVARKIVEAGIYTTPLSHYCVEQNLDPGLLFGFSGVNKGDLRRTTKRLKSVFKSLGDSF